MDIKLNPGAPQSGAIAVMTPSASFADSKTASQQARVSPVGSGKTQSQDLDEAVQRLQATANSQRRNLQFSLDESSGQVVVRVVARDSGELIRQIPSEEALRLAQRLKGDAAPLFDITV